MNILLNPGPVVLSDRVRQSLLKPDLCHREPEFVELQSKIRSDLLDVYSLTDKDWASVLMTGSGTAAMEAMLSSCVPDHGKVLIIENGVYGERLSKIAEIHGISCLKLHFDWGEVIDMNRLESELQYHEEISHVALVHHETTTGRLNDLDAIAKVCEKHKVPILLDAVSSFGAEKIEFEGWNIAACAATANKCLHGVPGTSFVIINKTNFKQTAATKPRSLYLNLHSYLESQNKGGTPFTQSIQTFYALAEALDELKESGGWQARQTLYQHRMKQVYDGLTAIGIKAMFESSENSCVLNAFHIPDNLDYTSLHDQLKAEGFVIYAGQGQYAKNIFRISCMGAIEDHDLQRLLETFTKIVTSVEI